MIRRAARSGRMVDPGRSPRKLFGFTLVEVMIAVGLLGTLGVVMISTAGRSSTDIALMQEKLEALHIAENVLNTMVALDVLPDTGSEEEVVTRGNRDWLLTITVSETANEKVRRIDALVKPYESLSQESDRSVVLLSAFKTDFR